MLASFDTTFDAPSGSVYIQRIRFWFDNIDYNQEPDDYHTLYFTVNGKNWGGLDVYAQESTWYDLNFVPNSLSDMKIIIEATDS